MSSSADQNHVGCASGPHEPNDTPAQRALMQQYRVSGATQPNSEHFMDRLIGAIPPGDHAQNIEARVNTILAILLPANTSPNGGN